MPFSGLRGADDRLFRRLVRRRSALADYVFWGASRAANRSLLWLAISGVLATRGERARRGAARGIVAIAIASTTVNGPLKFTWRRRRPRVSERVPRRGLIRPPTSPSFPSGHAASAFAFATAVSAELPPLTVPLGALASTVAYSRVHTGVHYPGDVLAGAIVGIGAGLAAGRLLDAIRDPEAAEEIRGSSVREVPRRAILVVNPRSGKAHLLERALRTMAEVNVEVVEEISIDNVERLAEWVALARATPTVVVAAGGDGTVGAVADYVADTDAVLAVLPLGTSNDFARSIGVPTDPAEAARLLATGKVSAIDAGRLVIPGEMTRHFVHAATAGLNISFAKLATKASMRERFGRLTYAIAGAAALREHQPFTCELSFDGVSEQVTLLHLSVINAPVFGGFLGLRIAGASVADHRLDVIAVEHLPIRRLILAAVHPILGIRREIRGVRTLQLPSLLVSSERVLDVALDGEIAARIPAAFEVASEGLRVVTPLTFAGGHR